MLKKFNFGALDRIDANLAQYDLIFGAGEAVVPKDWSGDMPAFRNQGAKPFCGGYSLSNAKYALDHNQNGNKSYNPDWIFYAGGGIQQGSCMPDLMSIVRYQGMVLDEDKPVLNPAKFDYSQWDKQRADTLNVSVVAKERMKIAKIDSFSILYPQFFADALQHSPVILLVEFFQTYYEGLSTNYVKAPAKGSKVLSRHFVTLEKFLDNGDFQVMDSITNKAGFDGHRIFNKDYPVVCGYSMRDLPLEWNDIMANQRRTEFWNCLAHYNLPRRFEDEVKVGYQMVVEFKKFKNDSVFNAASRFWTILINMVTYGGYSYTDCINFIYAWRRTGKYIFNVNNLRKK